MVPATAAPASGVANPATSSAPLPASLRPAISAFSRPRLQADRFEGARGLGETVRHEPAQQLLRPVPHEQAADQNPQAANPQLHNDFLA